MADQTSDFVRLITEPHDGHEAGAASPGCPHAAAGAPLADRLADDAPLIDLGSEANRG